MTASLLKSPVLFSVFWPISTMLLFGWSPFVLFFQALHSLYQSWGDCTKSINYNWHHSHFHLPQFFRSSYLSFFSLSFNFTPWSTGTAKSTIKVLFSFLFFSFFLLGLFVWLILSDPLVCQNPRGVCASHSPGQILGYAYAICSYGQNQFLTQFSGDHLVYPVTSSLILFLC